jgi:arginine utilization regulatory protein
MPKVDDQYQELVQKYEALAQENQMLKDIIENIHESVFVIDQKRKITLYNRETERIEGMNKEDVLGKYEDEVYPDYIWSDDVTNRVIKAGKPIVEQSYKYTLPGGRKINIIYSTFPFHYQGRLAAIYTIARNVNQIGEFIAHTLEMQKKFIKEDSRHNGTTYLLDDIIGVSEKHYQKIGRAHV